MRDMRKRNCVITKEKCSTALGLGAPNIRLGAPTVRLGARTIHLGAPTIRIGVPKTIRLGAPNVSASPALHPLKPSASVPLTSASVPLTSPALRQHYARARISAAFHDLSPQRAGGYVEYEQTSSSLVVTFSDISVYADANLKDTFQ
eukprot:2588116-Pyramimonas_sp.AAC.1